MAWAALAPAKALPEYELEILWEQLEFLFDHALTCPMGRHCCETCDRYAAVEQVLMETWR